MVAVCSDTHGVRNVMNNNSGCSFAFPRPRRGSGGGFRNSYLLLKAKYHGTKLLSVVECEC